MRIYSILLGVLLTAGSAYLGELAVASAGMERLAGLSPGELWYGGVLDPITIEVTGARQAIASEHVCASMGSMM